MLVACEESQTVTKELRARGHEAYSCDIEPCSGGHPEWHLQQDVVPLLEGPSWDMILAFPPCTHLAVAGAAKFAEKRADGRQQQGIDFFMQFTKVNCPKVAIENPVGIMSTVWRKPDQIVQPYMFDHKTTKKTCLWLKGLPLLVPTDKVDGQIEQHTFSSTSTKPGGHDPKWHIDSLHLPPKERARVRSKTFPGFARAMAEQWG